jgi:hypothetical protein
MIKKIFVFDLCVFATLTITLSSCSDMPWETTSPNPPWLMSERAMQQAGGPSTIVSYNQARLAQFSMNEAGNEVTVRPRQKIRAMTAYEYNCPNCNAASANQIIVGIAGRSAQACIYQGGLQGTGTASFELKAPAMPGEYEVRFKPIQAEDCQSALQKGWGDEAPSKAATIGKIIVQQKPKKELPEEVSEVS